MALYAAAAFAVGVGVAVGAAVGVAVGAAIDTNFTGSASQKQLTCVCGASSASAPATAHTMVAPMLAPKAMPVNVVCSLIIMAMLAPTAAPVTVVAVVGGWRDVADDGWARTQLAHDSPSAHLSSFLSHGIPCSSASALLQINVARK